MQNHPSALECLNCWYINDINAENCAQCGAIIQFKSRPAPFRDRQVAEPPKAESQSFKIWACLIIVLAALGFAIYQFTKTSEPVRAVRPAQRVVRTDDDDPAVTQAAQSKSKTAEEIGTRPLDSEKEKESVANEYRKRGGDEGCSTQFTVNRAGQRIPLPPSPDKPLTIHGITAGVYYEKIENYALAEASFDIDRTCGENARGTFTVRRQYVWKTLGSGFYYWEPQPDGFDKRIADLVRKQRETAQDRSETVDQATREAEFPAGGANQKPAPPPSR